jgi:hypothetical protein
VDVFPVAVLSHMLRGALQGPAAPTRHARHSRSQLALWVSAGPGQRHTMGSCKHIERYRRGKRMLSLSLESYCGVSSKLKLSSWVFSASCR